MSKIPTEEETVSDVPEPYVFRPRDTLQHNLVPIRFYKEKPAFKETFLKRYKELTDFEIYEKYTFAYLNRAIRVNTLKISVSDLKKRLEPKGWLLEKIPWMDFGFWVEHIEGRRDLGNTVEHQLGYFYIQEAASMIPPIALDPKEGDVVFDMCSAPGSKTTQIAQMMNNKGLVYANEVSGTRMAPLGVNIQRMGISCVLQVQHDGMRLTKPKFLFDKILLDAPCSGSGTIRKSLKTITMWNPKMIQHIATIQRKLFKNAWGMLKPGGTLVYSTCSTEPEENEEMVSNFINENPDAKLVEFDLPGFKRADAVVEFEGKKYNEDVKKTLRVWPQDNDTEGFFVAKIIKSE